MSLQVISQLYVGLKHRGQRVLLLLDNCSSHDVSGVTFRFTDILFLPPNTTSRIQPMDAGIIINFKRNYRRFHVRWMLQRVEDGQRAEELKMNVLQAIHFIIQGWDEVKANAIQNCWYHTRIIAADNNSDLSPLEDFHQTTDPVLNEISDALEALNFPDSMNVEEFLAISEENVVYEVFSDDQVITELVETFRMNDPADADLEDADDSLEVPLVSANMAIVSLKTVLTFLLQQDDAETYINLVGRIEKFIKKMKVVHMRQSKIDQFFMGGN
ncbi:7636_t:CDS:2 [Cetraspora pellucida]|uniref:7636_t:CDS:1 n=1 Tax=Cetraspora pellucida TaxID=1433469 RepID=A0ACA9KK97_9GLOM|nr:7636_t:CDS:2 [Cetraspora pellucida]